MQIFELLQFWAFFGFGRSRDQRGSIPRTRFTPSALAQRSADPNRTIFGLFWTAPGRKPCSLRGFRGMVGGGSHTLVTVWGPFWGLGPLLKNALRSGSDLVAAHDLLSRRVQNQNMAQNGPIWVRRPLEKCTGGETGPKKRSPLVPRPSEAKKDPKQPKFKNLHPIYF